MRPSGFAVTALRASTRLLILAACAWFGGNGLAHGQWGDRNHAAGQGFTRERWEIHPGVALRAGYGNNVYNADGKGQPEQGAGMLGVTPHLLIRTVDPQADGTGVAAKTDAAPKLALRSALSATYLQAFKDYAPSGVEADSELWLGVMPGRPVNVEISGAYVRTIRPFTVNTGHKSDFVWNQLRPTLRINAENHAHVLSAYAAYTPALTHYKGHAFSYLDAWTHTTDVGLAWRFLPSTALLYDFTAQAIDYSTNSRSDAPLAYADMLRFRMRSGLNGAITNHVSLRALAGYASVMLRPSQRDTSPLSEVGSAVGEATLTYSLAESFSLDGGYVRDVAQAALGGAITIDRARAGLRFHKSAFSGSLEAAYGYLDYARVIDRAGVGLGVGGDDERKDHRIDGTLHLEYELLSFLSVLADLAVTTVQTDFDYARTRVDMSNNTVSFPDPADYTSVTAFGGVRAYY